MLTWPFHSQKRSHVQGMRLNLYCVFSVNVDAHLRMITTIFSYVKHLPLQRLQEIIWETKFCFLISINVSDMEFWPKTKFQRTVVVCFEKVLLSSLDSFWDVVSLLVITYHMLFTCLVVMKSFLGLTGNGKYSWYCLCGE